MIYDWRQPPMSLEEKRAWLRSELDAARDYRRVALLSRMIDGINGELAIRSKKKVTF